MGVSPDIDKAKLRRHYNLDTYGLFDLRYARLLAGYDARQGGSLAAMADQHLCVTMDKTEQMSDWEADLLTVSQVEYAALDVTVAVDLYKFFSGRYASGADLEYVDKIWVQRHQ